MSKSIRKSSTFKIIAAIVIVIALAAFVVPFIIKWFFAGILFMFEQPLMAIIIIGAFILGMLLQAYSDKIDRFIDGE